jgi:hypothetical protein
VLGEEYRWLQCWMQSHTSSTRWVTMSHCHSLARKEDNSIVPPAEPTRRRWRSSRLVAMAVRVLDYMYYSACHLTDAPLSMGALSAACHTMSCTVQTTANLQPACQIACCIQRRCMMGSHQASPRQQRCTEQAIASHRIPSHRPSTNDGRGHEAPGLHRPSCLSAHSSTTGREG